MKNLSLLLKKFSNILDKDTVVKDSILKVIEDKTKIKLTKENFFLKDGLLEIKASPVIKNEINFKEKLIRDELNNSYKIFISKIIYK
ncbi:hypothetical protein GW944_00895 [Candidatus Parcubacteria bacterium]|nr:hypothetical protein [Candidatus Parcubacteria bacterium]